jgi:hypothetical protein
MTDGITLREFIERLLADHSQSHKDHAAAHEREHRASQAAIDTAAQLARENKADANEWRAAMTDRERSFVRVDTVEGMERRIRILESTVVPSSTVDSMRERIGLLERTNAQMQGALAIARFVGFGGLVTAVGALVWAVTQPGTR